MNILHLEDHLADAELVGARLAAAWPDCTIEVVMGEADYASALDRGGHDVILADFTVPGFGGLNALELARTRRPDTPFIFVSGTLGEETAIESLQHGALDYVLKDRIERLIPAVERALREGVERRRRRTAELRQRESEERLALVARATNDAIWDWNLATDQLWWNEAFETLFGFRRAEIESDIRSWTNRIHPDDLGRVKTSVHHAIEQGLQTWSSEYRFRRADGTYAEVFDRSYILRDPNRRAHRMLGSMQDITARKRAEALVYGERQLLEMIAAHEPVPDILNALVRLIEAQSPGLLCSVLLLHPDGKHFITGAAPSLPAEFNATVGRGVIGPAAGSCGTSVHRRQTVIVEDVATDPLWADDRAAALKHGLRASWSSPVFDANRRIIATFAIYRATPGAPSEFERQLIDAATHLVSICICHQQAAAALRVSEENYRTLFERANDGICITAADGTLLEVNPRACEMLGLSREDLLGKNFGEFIAAEDRPKLRAGMEQLSATGANVNEYRFIRADGVPLIGETSTKILPDRRLLGIMRDVTARKAAEQQIRDQAEILNQARDGIMVSTLEGAITFWNQGAEQIFGLSSSQVLGRTVDAVFGEQDRATLNAARLAVDKGGEWNGEFNVNRPDGRPVVVDVRAMLVRDDAGRPKARLSIATDITEKKRLEDRFLRSQRMESIGLLAAGIAHDLNNVLAPILMGAPMLRERTTNPADVKLLATMEKSAERGAALVRQILGFAQGVGGQLRPVQIQAIARDLATVVAHTFPKSIVLEQDFPADLWTVHAHPTHLHQVLLNLSVNARDAMPKGGTLRLRGRNALVNAEHPAKIKGVAPGSYVLLEISDTGGGIPASVLDRIWEPFFTTKDADRGTGLGLSTVRGIIENHRGAIGVETAVGRGTTFVIYLPAADGPAKPPTAAPFSLSGGDNELILIVDDEADIREVITDTLVRNGYRVLAASNGTDAVATFAPRIAEIALVISDLHMPGLEGATLAAVLRRLKPDVRLLAMSGMSGGNVKPGPLPEVFQGAFMKKPFTVETLLQAVRRQLCAPSK
ncbi:MAG: signal transduction histidine kinase, nitrogen specific, NtrB [Verrucomicrobia bacterium]|nr:signal transduction histidine kinase, nitrogen specific, NtrB [Verrucomicrobiota bacterium]